MPSDPYSDVLDVFSTAARAPKEDKYADVGTIFNAAAKKTRSEVTQLSPIEEPRFRAWAAQSGIKDVDHPESYYDYRGLYKELGGKPVPTGPNRHFPDTYKQHGHPTFSVESRYSAGPDDGGHWNGETYVPAKPATTRSISAKRERPNVGLPMEQGPRAGSPLENLAALGIDAATGFAEGLGGTVGLVADAALTPVRGMTAGAKALAAGEGYGGAVKAGTNAMLSMPATRTATAAAEDFRKTARDVTGTTGVAIGPTGDVTRFVANIATPMPFAKAARPVAKVVESVAAEEAPAAARAAEAARVLDAPTAEKIIKDELKARAGEQIPVAPTPDTLPKYAEPSAINLDHLNIDDDAKVQIVKTAQAVGRDLEKVKGAPLTHEEIVEAAKTSEVLREATSRADTLKRTGIALRTRQHLAALAEGKGVPAEFVDTLKVLSSEATRAGRELNAFAIGADPALATSKESVVKKLLDIGVATDDIVKAAEDVDFTDSKQVTAFYRTFVKPTLPEILDEYRYINLLSSPKTHIVNAFSNLVQTTVLRPATRLASGVIDTIGSKLTGAERQYYVSQVPAYYKGVANNFGKAASSAIEALRGKTPLTNLDVRRIPTNIGPLKPFQIIPRALEASDVFFRTLVEGGELESLASAASKGGKAIDETKIAKQAADTAREVVFRKELDPTNKSGHGDLLSTIDKLTGVVHELRHVPTVKWFIPFVETPMNIFKQGIEYSPAGLATLKGSTRKTEQLAKAAIGSTVFAGAATLAWDGRSTWSPPRAPKDRAAFYAAGLQPYAVKIGDKWVSYTKLGPIAYPIAMAAAMRYAAAEDPKAAVRSNTAKATRTLAGIAEFFSDQSYVEGLGNLIAATRGDEGALTNVATTFPVQLVPLSSLQRWVTQIVDPIYRKADRDLSVNAVKENIMKGIPGLSTRVPPQLTPDGTPSVRQYPVVNAFSPLGFSSERPVEMQEYLERRQAARLRALDKAGVQAPADSAQQEYLRNLMGQQ